MGKILWPPESKAPILHPRYLTATFTCILFHGPTTHLFLVVGCCCSRVWRETERNEGHGGGSHLFQIPLDQSSGRGASV